MKGKINTMSHRARTHRAAPANPTINTLTELPFYPEDEAPQVQLPQRGVEFLNPNDALSERAQDQIRELMVATNREPSTGQPRALTGIRFRDQPIIHTNTSSSRRLFYIIDSNNNLVVIGECEPHQNNNNQAYIRAVKSLIGPHN